MNKEEINDIIIKLNNHMVEFEKIIKDLIKIKPDEPIGEARNKMARDFHYANDVAYYTQLVLNDDPWTLYQDLAEDMKD